MSKENNTDNRRGSIKPKQRLSYKNKIKDKNEWGKANIDYHISLANFYDETSTTAKNNIAMYYKIANNEIPEGWFNYVTNPLNSTNPKYTSFPARIREYNIVIPNFNLYIGEYIKRPFAYTIINTSSDAVNSFQEGLKSAMYNNTRTRYISSLVEKGAIDPSQIESPDQIPLPDEIEREYKKSYTDIKADKAFGALKQGERELRFWDIWLRCAKDFAIAGKTHTYKSISDSGDLVYERVNPLDIRTDFSNDHLYGENGSYAVRRKLVNLTDIVDLAYDAITEQEIDDIESGKVQSPAPYGSFGDLYYKGKEDLNTNDKFWLYHVTWKSLKKIGILSYIDEFGQPQEIEVDETYKADKDLGESVEWFWVTVWWEGYRYDEDKYFKIREISVQRNSLNDLSSNKCPYNCVYYSDDNSRPISVVSLGIPYLVLYMIMMYRIELTIAKSKGKILFFNQTLIPDAEEEDEEKFFYYSDATGWGLFDPSQEGADTMAGTQPYYVADMSLYNDISQMIQLKDSIAQDYDELLGITRQRKGNVSASDSVGGTQLATLQSSTISEYFFKKFEDFKEVELQGLLDLSKFAYASGKKGMYLTDDIRKEILEIDEGDFANAEFGLHITTKAKDIGNVQMLKQMAQSFAQNGTKASTVAQILQANSMSEISSYLAQAEEIEQRVASENAKAEKASAQELEQIKGNIQKDYEGFKHSLELEKIELENDREDNRELIKIEGNLELENVKAGNVVESPSALVDSIEKNNLEREKVEETKRVNKNNEQIEKRKLDQTDNEQKIKIKDIESKERIAKENKNQYDTKK
jgi:hypothetical protein